jgi:hypothetical protein
MSVRGERPHQRLKLTGAGIPAFRGITVLQPAPLLNFVVSHLCLLGEQSMHGRLTISIVLGMILAPSPRLHAQSDLQRNLKDTNVGKHWIYNDLKEGNAQAQATGKPLLVVFRCVP